MHSSIGNEAVLTDVKFRGGNWGGSSPRQKIYKAHTLANSMKRYGKEHKAWRARVIERDKLCVVCKNGPKYLNAHHLIPKNFKKYALDLDNGIALCPHCHTLGKNSAHKHPLWFVEWMRIHRRFQYILAMHRIRKDEI